MIMKSYHELLNYKTFKERYEYLQTNSKVGEESFGFERYLNQQFYNGYYWKKVIKPEVIIRDKGCDLGIPDLEIVGPIYVHHIEAITPNDIITGSKKLYDLDNLICCSFDTHNGLTYGTPAYDLDKTIIERKPNDTCPWK